MINPTDDLQELREKALADMKAAVEISKGDEEQGHVDADNLLADFVRALGYGDIAEEFEKVRKWYA